MKKWIWYMIKNIVMAIGISVIGTCLASSTSLILTLLGIYIVFLGISTIGETSMGVSVGEALVGILIIILSETVMKEDLSSISEYISAGFIGIIALLEYKFKAVVSRGKETWQRVITLILFIIYPLLFIIGAVVAVFLNNVALANTLFSFGSVCWILHTILVVYFATKGTSSKTSSKSSSSYNYNSAVSSGNVASESKVASEMRSLANYFTGGFDDLGYGVSIKYSVSVTINSGDISFSISGKLSGLDKITSDSQVSIIKSTLDNKLKKRVNTVLDRANNRLHALGPNRDYSINVRVSGVS